MNKKRELGMSRRLLFLMIFLTSCIKNDTAMSECNTDKIFVEGYARMVAPLRVLQRKKRWKKGDMTEGSQERAIFERVRDALVLQVKLQLPDWSKTFVVESDWSEEGIGGALLQEDTTGNCDQWRLSRGSVRMRKRRWVHQTERW